jgi:hypothetical protein
VVHRENGSRIAPLLEALAKADEPRLVFRLCSVKMFLLGKVEITDGLTSPPIASHDVRRKGNARRVAVHSRSSGSREALRRTPRAPSRHGAERCRWRRQSQEEPCRVVDRKVSLCLRGESVTFRDRRCVRENVRMGVAKPRRLFKRLQSDVASLSKKQKGRTRRLSPLLTVWRAWLSPRSSYPSLSMPCSSLRAMPAATFTSASDVALVTRSRKPRSVSSSVGGLLFSMRSP